VRRFALFLTLTALVALAVAAGAAAESAKPYPRVIVKTGSAHLAGKKLVGFVVAINDGRARSGREFIELGIGVPKNPESGETSALVQRLRTKPLGVGKKQRIHFSHLLPAEASPGGWTVTACIDGGTCRLIGQVTIPGPVPTPAPTTPNPAPAPSPTPPGTPAPAPLTEDVPPISTVPTDPIPYVAGTPFEVTSGAVPYWAFVPDSYDASNLTPAPLLIWLHGCGGESSGDIWVVDPGASGEPQDWLTIAVGGREGECWTPSADEAKVLAALADVETHFNVDRRRVILGGYSSGGDLAYRTGFRHSSTFAGLLIENSSPFRDTESSAAESLAAATTKLHIVHLAHTGDTTYPLAGVQKEVGEVAAAGFPIELIVRPGAHYDANTDNDLRELLLPHIDDGWLS
jgi:dienelactone hydrolase